MRTYSPVSEASYNPLDEYHNNPLGEHGRATREKARLAFRAFFDANRQRLDLLDPASILTVFDKAEQAGIFQHAADVRREFRQGHALLRRHLSLGHLL